MITSNFLASRAGIMPSHAVGTNSTCQPESAAKRLATSISKPISSPCLSRIAQGTKVDIPTRSVPRSLIASRLGVSLATAGKVKARPNKPVSKVLTLNRPKRCPNNCIRVPFLFRAFFRVMVSATARPVYVLAKLITLIESGLTTDRSPRR
ncbi:Uncharacterised protein [Vibrio cholerae]|nr:Uncharacterised protein [Vibrio cholerae]